jgi:Flp pilus assembly protein TadB
MEATRRSPAQLYALIAGATLLIWGIAGLFFDSEITGGVHIVTGLVALILARSYSSARLCALSMGAAYIGLAVWGFAAGDSAEAIVHVVVGIGGLGAGAVSPTAYGLRPTAS